MKSLITLFLISMSLAESAFAESFIRIRSRCDEQNLDPAPAHERNVWARKCFPQLAGLIDQIDSESPRSYVLVATPDRANWSGPVNAGADCGSWQFVATCVASCFMPDQEVLFSDGNLAIERAASLKKDGVVALREDSTLDRLSFQVLPVESYTISRTDFLQKIRVFKMKSGGELKVTANHPVFVVPGMIKAAEEVETGELLVRQGGGLTKWSRFARSITSARSTIWRRRRTSRWKTSWWPKAISPVRPTSSTTSSSRAFAIAASCGRPWSKNELPKE